MGKWVGWVRGRLGTAYEQQAPQMLNLQQAWSWLRKRHEMMRFSEAVPKQPLADSPALNKYRRGAPRGIRGLTSPFRGDYNSALPRGGSWSEGEASFLIALFWYTGLATASPVPSNRNPRSGALSTRPLGSSRRDDHA